MPGKLILVAMAICFIVQTAHNVSAQTLTWSNSSGGHWETAANWTPAKVPSAGDDVIIAGVEPDVITIDSEATINTLVLEGNHKLTLESGKLTTSSVPPDIWIPDQATSWQWQLTTPVDQSVDAMMYDIDLFENDVTVISSLHAKGRKVICYFSAGSWEEWRPDATSFPSNVIGADLDAWPGEKWLDIGNLAVLGPIMTERLDLAVQKGCDGVEPDNVDGYSNKTGFPLTASNQIDYNRFIAAESHKRGLSVGLKNDLDQVNTLLPDFDWALNEQCFEFDEYDMLVPFAKAGKAVFNVEYNLPTEEFCPQANDMNFNSLKKNLDLDSTRTPCR
jgi:hypothetical protein